MHSRSLRPAAARALLVLLLAVGITLPASAQRVDRHAKGEEGVIRDLRGQLLSMRSNRQYEKAFKNYLSDASGNRMTVGDALAWLKIGEAAASGDYGTARDESAKWAVGKMSPMAGTALAAIEALKVSADAVIANWVEDLYSTRAYQAVGSLVVETVVDRAKKDRAFLPSIWVKGANRDGSLDYTAEQMRAVESELFERWRNEYQVDIDTLEYAMGSRLRQELGYDPGPRQLFNHFYAMTVRDMRGFLLANFQRLESKKLAEWIREEVQIAHGAAMDELSEADRRRAWDTIARGPERPPEPPPPAPWTPPRNQPAPQSNPRVPSIDVGPYGTILDNGIPSWIWDDYRAPTYPTLPPYAGGWFQPPPPSSEPAPSVPATSTGNRGGSWGTPGPIPTTAQSGDIPTTADLQVSDGAGGWSEPFICGTRRKDGAMRLDGYPHGMAASAAFCAGGRGYGSVDACRKNAGCYTVDLCSRVGRWDNPCVEFGICCPAR